MTIINVNVTFCSSQLSCFIIQLFCSLYWACVLKKSTKKLIGEGLATTFDFILKISIFGSSIEASKSDFFYDNSDNNGATAAAAAAAASAVAAVADVSCVTPW